MPIYNVYQDGAQFYCNAPYKGQGEESLAFVWSAPIRVRDHDAKAAERARNMFTEFCANYGINFIWE